MKWYWVDADDDRCAETDLTGFGFEDFVPHFYCIKTGESHNQSIEVLASSLKAVLSEEFVLSVHAYLSSKIKGHQFTLSCR